MREPKTLTATFEGWKLPDGRTVKTTFEITLSLESRGSRNYRWIARIKNTGQPFSKDFAESCVHDAKKYVAGRFEKQVSEWA